MAGSGQRIFVTRRAALTMFAAAGLAACGQGQTDRRGGLRADAAVIGTGPAGIALVSKIDRDQRHELLLVDQAGGRVRWRQALPGPLPLDMNPHLDQLALVTAGDVVLHTPGPRGGNPAFLAAYRADGGRLRWRIPMQAGGWPTWTADGRLLVVGAPAGGGGSQQSLLAVDVRGGRLLWHSQLPLNADRPAAPLGAGAVIQVWDPQRACAAVGTADAGDKTLPHR